MVGVTLLRMGKSVEHFQSLGFLTFGRDKKPFFTQTEARKAGWSMPQMRLDAGVAGRFGVRSRPCRSWLALSIPVARPTIFDGRNTFRPEQSSMNSPYPLQISC
jgi:hypothetical protein